VWSTPAAIRPAMPPSPIEPSCPQSIPRLASPAARLLSSPAHDPAAAAAAALHPAPLNRRRLVFFTFYKCSISDDGATVYLL